MAHTALKNHTNKNQRTGKEEASRKMIPFAILGTLGIITFLVFLLITPFAPKRTSIPAVPLWVSLYDACRGVSRLQFYKTRLQPLLDRHGAVFVWNAGRWTVLVTKPEYLMRMFRNEATVAKGGFYRKVPWGSFAMLFGENIIDSHGPTWAQFSSIIKPGIQKPTDTEPVRVKSSQLARLLLDSQKSAPSGQGVMVDPLIQRWAVAVYGTLFLDSEINCLDDAANPLENALTAVKANVVGPIFSEFPILEKASCLFPQRRRAIAAIKTFERLLIKHVDSWAESPASEYSASAEKEKLAHRLVRARNQNELTEFHYRSNLKMLTIAGHENVQLALTSALWEIGVHQSVQGQLREEASKLPENYTVHELDQLPYLTAVIYEVLRLYPPISQLINRLTLEEFQLDTGISIPKGTWMGWNCYGVHTNPEFWGEFATVFQPSRWGSDIESINSLFRRSQARGHFIPFNAHARKCPGSGFAIVQMKVALVEILRKVSWTVDPTYHFSTTSRSVLAPRNCRLIFTPR
ncbi:putative sporulation-specific N-formyltyrosine oxidase Dit2 [Aspergillus steynii IBT 23096]|uniref:Putative sporulation-specific N-formyltyrosine oxidase Dit2 n=1 Tax=Aspergillus steynii IBT 23096 TaxID=1392250 RepID=A0A2I2GAR7_9EURO|nr:putative sporulation-specific N-formyltyrosine oxidase Dit2 [Aspergillus steynii IBT 23096]PLB49960.1 putative sporulation-specific N-formyltyrosine oxidase Dit2 [Aspergillus steynii IBT 23096]